MEQEEYVQIVVEILSVSNWEGIPGFIHEPSFGCSPGALHVWHVKPAQALLGLEFDTQLMEAHEGLFGWETADVRVRVVYVHNK